MSGLTDIPQDQMEEAMQRACDEQAEVMERKREAKETVEFIKEQYGDVLRRLADS